MFRLMIADDEYIVRQGLKKSLPLEKLGVQWVGDADCVSDAVETIRDVYPDIVLCDIRMPGGNGFSIIKEARRIVPWIQFIMLTAYSDRDLMREAIQLDVCDYLFKPTNIDDVCVSIERAKERILEEQQKRERDREYRSFIFEHADDLRKSLIRQILAGEDTEEKLRKSARKLQIDLRGPRYCVAKIWTHSDNWKKFLSEANALLERYHASCAQLGEKEGQYVLLLNCRLEDSVSMLQAMLNVYLPCSVQVSECCKTIDELAVVYKLIAEEPVFRSAVSERTPDQEMLQRREQILEAVKYHDSAEEICRQLCAFWEYGQKTNISLEELKLECWSIGETIRVMCGLSACSKQQWEKPLQAMAALCHELQESSGYHVNDVAGKVMYHLKRRYAEDLSREQIAAELFVSASYMSRVVKTQTGHGFTYWLNYYRIEAAKKLLVDPSVSIDQISSMIGYNSYRIFSNNFRKYTQTTATAWRKMYSYIP